MQGCAVEFMNKRGFCKKVIYQALVIYRSRMVFIQASLEYQEGIKDVPFRQGHRCQHGLGQVDLAVHQGFYNKICTYIGFIGMAPHPKGRPKTAREL